MIQSNMKRILTILAGLLFCAQLLAQSPSQDKFYKAGPNAYPEIINASISGAPKLRKPILIMGNGQPVVAKGLGIAAPAFYDWDGDGKKDLLIGEFGSGAEHGHVVGHFLRVYRNVGNHANPQFTNTFDYAKPAYDQYSNGTPLSTKQD